MLQMVLRTIIGLAARFPIKPQRLCISIFRGVRENTFAIPERLRLQNEDTVALEFYKLRKTATIVRLFNHAQKDRWCYLTR
jgi:hypothetical protein